MACEYKYVNKGYPTESVIKLADHHYDVVDKLKATGVVREYKNKLILKKTGKVGIPNEQKLNNTIKIINDSYNAPVVKKKFSTDRIIVSVDMNEAAGMLVYNDDAAKRVDKNKWVANEHIIDGEVTPTQRQKFINHDPDKVQYETLESFVNKAEAMETVFRNKGINVSIVMDSDLEDSGQLLGTSDIRYRERVNNGSINEGDSLILINPNKVFTDTITHEFSHLFIDLAGGLNNTRIKNAVNQLKETELWNTIAEVYPELNNEMLAKEVLAQAMGKSVSDIIINPSQSQTSWWTNFFNWLRDIISKKLGMNRDLVQELSQDFVHGKFDITGELDTESQSLKDVPKFVEKDYNTYEGLSKIAVNKLKTILSSIKNDEKGTVKAFYQKRIDELLEDINNNDHKGALLRFVDEVNRQSNSLLKRMGETGEKGKIDAEFLNNVDKYNMAFSLISDVQNLVIRLEDLGVLEANSEISTKVDETVKNHNKVITRKRVYALDILTEEMLPFNNEVRVTYEEEFARDFNNINKDNKGIVKPRPGETEEQFQARKEKYIKNKVQENWDQIVQEQRVLTRSRLQESPYDIDAFAAWVKDEKQMSPYSIKMASALLDRADTEKDLAFLDTRARAMDIFQRFHKDRPQSDPKEKYKNILTFDKEGNGYIANEISPQFAKDYAEFTKELLNKYDKNTKEGRKKIFDERTAFKRQHFTGVNKNGFGGHIKTTSKYYTNLDNLSTAEKEMREFLIETIKKSDTNLGGTKSLITEFNGVEIIKLPGIGKEGFEKLVSGNLVDNASDWARGLVQRRQDDTEYGSNPDEQSEGFKNFKKVFADQAGRERQLVPIYFRDRMDPKHQSYDLLSIVLMDNYMSENYKAKTRIQNTLEVLRDITGSKKVNQTSGLGRVKLINGMNQDDMEQIEAKSGINSKEYQVLSSIIENRLYGIKTINSELGAVAGTIMSLTGSIMLGFNYFSAIPNVLQGKVMNFIEGVAGEHYTKKDVKNAESKFWKDMNGWVGDIGANSPNSKTRLLHDMLSIQGEFKGLANRFARDSRWKAMMTKSNQYAFNHMGEFYIQATAMYSLLGNIKVKNKNGQYINKEGKPVSTKAEAMSLDEAYEVKDGKLVLNENVDTTSFNESRSVSKGGKKSIDGELGIIFDTRRLVNKVIADMHGQYNDEIQSAAQRTVIGKLVFMLRKWLLRGFDRRWRGAYKSLVNKEDLRPEDRFFSEDLMAYQEGTYTTAIRFINYMFNTHKSLTWTLLSSEYSQLTAHEKGNIKRTIAELGFMLLSLLAAYGLKALGEDAEDEESQNLLYFGAFAFRRLHMELSTFLNPFEAFQMIRSPTAALNILENMGKLLAQLFTDPFAEYERGIRKGELKLWKKTKDVLPILNNVDRNVEEAMSFTFNLY